MSEKRNDYGYPYEQSALGALICGIVAGALGTTFWILLMKWLWK